MRQVNLPINLLSEKQAPSTRRLVLKVLAAAPSGERKQIRILVDTGAEVNLIKPGLFNDTNFEKASKPLRLVTVSGSDLGGGKRTTQLVLHLHGEDPRTGSQSHHLMGGIFYEAAIGWDAILSYPLLQEEKIGVLPNRNCLVLDQGDNFIMLGGGAECPQSCGKAKPKPKFTDHCWVQSCDDSTYNGEMVTDHNGEMVIDHNPEMVNDHNDNKTTWLSNRRHKKRLPQPELKAKTPRSTKLECLHDGQVNPSNVHQNHFPPSKPKWHSVDYAVAPHIVETLIKDFKLEDRQWTVLQLLTMQDLTGSGLKMTVPGTSIGDHNMQVYCG